MSVARLPLPMLEAMHPVDRDRTAWVMVDDQVIFLDLCGDRYFTLGDIDNAVFLAAIGRGEIPAWHLPHSLPKPQAWEEPCSDPPVGSEQGLDIAGLAATLWIERRVERRIRTTPFGELLLGVRTTVEKRAVRAVNARPEGLAAIVAGSERARLIRSAPDRCVPRSLALVLRCASHGLRAHAVIGVRTRPFAAHCWAQHGPIVLSDPLETVAPFTPILVI